MLGGIAPPVVGCREALRLLDSVVAAAVVEGPLLRLE